MAKPLRDYPDLLTIADVMEILRIGRFTVYRYIKENKLPAKKLAGKYRIPKTGIAAIIHEIEKDLCYNNGSRNSGAL